MKANIATVVIQGFASGIIIVEYILNSLAPSTLAAYVSSLGKPTKNCLKRKIKNGLPKKHVTVRGKNVPIHPHFVNIMNSGIIVTWKGNTIVANTIIKTLFLIGQWSLANPYATKELDKVEPTILKNTISSVFFKYLKKGIAVNICL
jgi:uncharacterized membrane protein